MTTVCSWLYPVVETKKTSLVRPKLWKVASSLTCKPNRQLASLMCPTLALIRFVLVSAFPVPFVDVVAFPLTLCSISATTGSLRGANIPAVWILGEPSFAPGSRPSQQHLQHFPSPHDCYSFCLITSIVCLFFPEQCQHQPFWIEPVWNLEMPHLYEFDCKTTATTKHIFHFVWTQVFSFTSPSP